MIDNEETRQISHSTSTSKQLQDKPFTALFLNIIPISHPTTNIMSFSINNKPVGPIGFGLMCMLELSLPLPLPLPLFALFMRL